MANIQGVMRLDPVTAVPLWTEPSPTDLATITWTVPNQTVLVGMELHYQAAVFDPSRGIFFTNSTRDVIQ